MSSWKKAGKSNQKVHRERAQPETRAHLGLLEKKQDYKRRANDQHEKDDTLKLLRKRALTRNPDEFYHHMINSKVQKGEHRELNQEKDEHSPAQKRLMHTQDLRYVSMKRVMESNKISRLQARLHMTDVANETTNKHIFFVDDEQEAREFDLAKRLQTHPSLIGRKTNRLKLEQLGKLVLNVEDEKVIQAMNEERKKSYQELQRRVEREKELTIIQQKMELKRALQAKRLRKAKRVVKGTKDNAPVYEFKYERKR
ncbi:probable U3 small nucleolar RNA-associated protein 11 [Malaya genurostris]|uniref:probable U3 small nucleolar RNA-associated protein 11 n=1 Tax=Malaya genurostris TaxID=325434 RepID=UPI0026F3B2CD|nr:probable U3 small nucleolar RNA-associated protein 11 [Malaya genurostris]